MIDATIRSLDVADAPALAAMGEAGRLAWAHEREAGADVDEAHMALVLR